MSSLDRLSLAASRCGWTETARILNDRQRSSFRRNNHEIVVWFTKNYQIKVAEKIRWLGEYEFDTSDGFVYGVNAVLDALRDYGVKP